MNGYEAPDFGILVSEDVGRIDQLDLSEETKKSVADLYHRWLMILYIEASKQRSMGKRPRVEIEVIHDSNVRRIVSMQFSGEKKRPFAEVWIDAREFDAEVMYRYFGFGYPTEAAEAIPVD